jgi:hypothetical protein
MKLCAFSTMKLLLESQDLIIKTSRSHSDTPHSVELLWTKDQARRRDLCLTTHNTYKRQTSMVPAGSEPAMAARELPPTHAIESAASRIASTHNAEGYRREQRVVFLITDTMQ